MISHFKLAERLGLRQAEELWTAGWSRFYPTSVVPNAAFEIKRNGALRRFSGSFQEVLDSPLMKKEFEEQFLPKLARTNKRARYIALGPTPRAALEYAIAENILHREQLLGSFAHPSPAANPQVEVYLQRKRPDELDPRNPILARVPRLVSDFAELTKNVESWTPR
jgi:hypothetical protein